MTDVRCPECGTTNIADGCFCGTVTPATLDAEPVHKGAGA